LTPSKRGRGGETMGRKKRRIGTLVCLFGLTACLAKEPLRKDGLPKGLRNRKS